jgi:hypothetical protein
MVSPLWHSVSPSHHQPGVVSTRLGHRAGKAFFVMVWSLPNGFFTAVPCEMPVVHADHSVIGLAASADEALAQLQQTLAGKAYDEIFPAK